MRLANSLCVLVLCASPAINGQSDLKEVKVAFNDAQIPADAHITFDPSVLLQVNFPAHDGSNGTVLETPGTQLSVAAVAPFPSFALKGNHLTTSGQFVIMMFDLDAPIPKLSLQVHSVTAQD
ncbi:hypothetical protein POSPLADRAFT_1037496 [Postia placenta MAD-698-R-SB12]|uniref:Uncharacterized protein n=1 Tax=Postia placenta MAD-698-R-SB12 TaxID=670580 RepID=A0A1X6MJA1_9APHY|nr:hypothetical protein POSPLADRAFT_1037496 [Postia placenta MAD-698-R-SB12]OSX56521.1 hypothetical protein POSPLADRAFT_1037496 [Postia placenta MAD-698-R-SB12]